MGVLDLLYKSYKMMQDEKKQRRIKLHPDNELPRVGDKVKVLSIDETTGPDPQACKMIGHIYTVKFIDDAGNIWLDGSGISLLPDVDRYEIVDRVDVN